MVTFADVLFLDCGNTRIKYSYGATLGVFDGYADFHEFLSSYHVRHVVQSNVGNKGGEVAPLCREMSVPHHSVEVLNDFNGLEVAYADITAFGVDRWLALLAVTYSHPYQNIIVVDAGTALTIDAVSSKKVHLGGYILPGFRLQSEALSAQTASLPLADFNVSLNYGVNTMGCISNGIALGLVALIERCVLQFSAEDVALVITGGDQKKLTQLLSCEFVVASNLVLEGLAIYWEIYNQSFGDVK